MARALARAFDGAAPEPVVTGEWRGGDVRHVVRVRRRAPRRELGFRAREDFEAGMREFARAPLRSP